MAISIDPVTWRNEITDLLDQHPEVAGIALTHLAEHDVSAA